jgi:imidazolonepropionase-like amidohydrolase
MAKRLSYMTAGWCWYGAKKLKQWVLPTGITVPAGAKVIELPGMTLMPGLIEAHSHVLLHPYTETVWNDQVAHESLSLRVARATNHLRNTLLAGFTTIRDLGTEGAGYADVGLKQAVQQGIIPGPRHARGDSSDRRHRELRSQRLPF